MEFVLGREENTVGKEENTGFNYFLLFPKCLQKVSIPRWLKVEIFQMFLVENKIFLQIFSLLLAV